MICEGSLHEYYVLIGIWSDSVIVVCFDLMFSTLTCMLFIVGQERCDVFDDELWMYVTIV